MSWGSITATGNPANGARTRSPARSCGIHWKVLDMKPNDLTIVQARPDARTVVSDSIMYLETALLMSPLAAELPDRSTTRRTPACLAPASVPARSWYPG